MMVYHPVSFQDFKHSWQLMKNSLLFITFSTCLFLNGCTFILDHLPGIYRIDIKQGNIIDQEMINELRPNMTKRQVLYILGSPMLTDTFHKQRWDYVYSLREKGEPTDQKTMTLYFEGENLSRIEGDFKPTNTSGIKPSKDRTIDVPPRKLDKTIWEMITGLFDFDDVPTSGERPQNKDTSTGEPLKTPDIPN